MHDLIEIACIVGIFLGIWNLGQYLEKMRDFIVELDDRLTKLEKDAVKITFSNPQTQQNEKRVIKPITEGKTKSQIKTYEGDIPMTQAPPPPKPLKTPGEWQSNNKRKQIVISDNPIRKKRKGKTVEEWEEEIDLGGHE